MRHGSHPDHRRPSREIECCVTTGGSEFYCLDEFSLDGTANADVDWFRNL